MKKYFLGIAIILAATTVGVNLSLNQQNSEISLILENVEALADDTEDSTSKRYDCYSIFEGTGTSISCATCQETTGTPPWYHFGSKCTR